MRVAVPVDRASDAIPGVRVYRISVISNKYQLQVFVGTDYQLLPSQRTLAKLRMSTLGIVHRSGGPFEEVIQFDSVADFVDALRDSAALRRAAGRFALERMRKGRLAGRYRASHSPQLARAALNRASRMDMPLPANETPLTRLRGGIARFTGRRTD